MEKLRVFRDHQLVGEFPSSAGFDNGPDGELFIRGPKGQLIQTFLDGEWHGAGHGVACAFVDPREDCPSCAKPEAGPAIEGTVTYYTPEEWTALHDPSSREPGGG
jgi:hypothetical protein